MEYDSNEARFTFDFWYENIGNSTAENVFPHFKFYCKTRQMPDVDVVLEKYIASQTNLISKFLGATMTKNETVVRRFASYLSYDMIRDTVESYRINGIATTMLPTYLIGVVTYTYGFRSTVGQTTFYYDVLQLEENNIPIVLWTTDQAIPANKLVVQESIIFGSSMS